MRATRRGFFARLATLFSAPAVAHLLPATKAAPAPSPEPLWAPASIAMRHWQSDELAPPEAPRDLMATAQSNGTILVTWAHQDASEFQATGEVRPFR